MIKVLVSFFIDNISRMWFKLCLLIALWFEPAVTYTIAIVGAHGGLGRELVYQSLQKKYSVKAVVRRDDPIMRPVRSGWLSPRTMSAKEIHHHNLTTVLYDDTKFSELCFDSIVFALSGKPFQVDESHRLVRQICDTLPSQCKKICLVSAFGVGSSIQGANMGIRAMQSWYLKDVYASKEIQEATVARFMSEKDVLILRPKVLSYDEISFNPTSTTRKNLASQILTFCEYPV